jgi:transposase
VSKRPVYSPEFREEAAKMVVESSRPIVQVAREIKVNEATLGGWVKRYRDKHADDESDLQLPDRARLRELERENRELKMKVEFLSKAAAYAGDVCQVPVSSSVSSNLR